MKRVNTIEFIAFNKFLKLDLISSRQAFIFLSSVLFLAMALFCTTSPVIAAERGYIRLGDDYSFKFVPRGKGYRWCERQCKNDDKCKSWTYLRPNQQCRLKSAIAPKYKNDCCVSGEKKGELSSSSQKMCRRYANKAIKDYETNQIDNCGFSGSPWTSSFSKHFDWCMTATVDDIKDRERNREDDLQSCKREIGADGGNISCRQYARQAMQQQQTNLDNNCGFNHKTRWRDDFNYYRQWCRQNTPEERAKQDKLKQDAIARCLRRGGGVFVKRCDTHAELSLKQVAKASRNGCGFRDEGKWRKKFSHHYQYCMKNNNSRDVRNRVLQKQRQSRAKEIKQCKTQLGGWGSGGSNNDNDYGYSPKPQTGGIDFATLRVGADYSFKTAPKGSDYLWCEDSCRSDPRCKAWTFIKKIRQCRLKYNKGTAVQSDCCVSGRKSTNQSRNDKENRCSGYAEDVMGLYEKGLKNNCYFEDKAWSNNFKDHYRFCMRKSKSRVEDDLQSKKSLISQCRDGQWQLNRQCSRYAKQAVAQNDMNLTKKCGFTRRSRWYSDFMQHYDWCSNHSRYERQDQIFQRKNYLAACVHRGGGRYSKTCDTFSQNALKDVKAAQNLGCGFHSKDWSNQFKDHYQWCLNSDNWQRRSEENTRQKSLKRCKASGGGKSRSTARCNHFARLAAEQARSNEANRCNLQSRHWKLSKVNALEKWCLKASAREQQSQFKEREEDLKSCFADFSNNSASTGNADKTCDDYARTALKQYRQGVSQDCRLRGAEWSDEYEDHYSWCLKASPSKRQRLIFSRKAVLKTCKLTSYFNWGK